MAPDARAVDSVAPVGRARECATVDTVLAEAAAGSHGLLLVGGDAGIGKTTLVGYVTARARDKGFLVLEGGCLDLDANVPFTPVVEAIRPLLRDGQDPARRPAAAAVAALAGARAPSEPLPQGQLLGVLREVLAEAARDDRVLLVLEDMHWAEPSTRDFALAMARGLPAGMVLMLTYRADDLHRRHPFRSTLNDVSRTDGCVRIDLAPLDRKGLALLVEQRTGRRPRPAFVRSLLARSEGNPLFAEELIADPTQVGTPDSGGVPLVLAELLLARVDALREPARDLIRAASVDGSRIDAELLAAVTGQPPEQVDADLRDALDANVVAHRAGHVEFRHGLLREAVYDDLLPGERARLHGAFAAAIERRGASDQVGPLTHTSQIAYHWYEAHDLPQAFSAAVRAGLLGLPFGAVESAGHFERALDLWDQVPAAEELGGMARADMLRLAAEGHEWGLDRERGRALIREAIEALGPNPDPLLACRVYTGYAGFWNGIGDVAGERAAVEKALRFAEGTVSVELARALKVKSRLAMRDGRSHEALALATRSLDVARQAGHPAAEGEAVFHKGLAEYDCGDIEKGLATLRTRVATSSRNEGLAGHLEAQSTLAFCELVAGRAETALALAREGAETARSMGLPSLEFGCVEQEVQALTWTGRLEDAGHVLDEVIARGMTGDNPHLLLSDVLLSRGDLEAAFEEEERYIRVTADLSVNVPEPFDAFRQVALFTAVGDVPRALRAADRYVRAAADGESPMYYAAAAQCGYAALNAARETGVEAPPDLVALLETLMSALRVTDPAPWRDTAPWGWLLTARASRQRLTGDPAPDLWEAAVAGWRHIGFAWNALAATVPLVEDLHGTGQRERAVELTTAGWHEARAMGARGLADAFEGLARRGRVRFEEPPDGDGPDTALVSRLTPREREVLDLVATGATNRAIGQALFISEKTVSVHLSNLMAKLGVTNRTEAAALARPEPPAR